MMGPKGINWNVALPVIVFLIALGVFFYLTVLRPEKGRVKKHMDLIANVKPGDRIVTAGGIHGTIRSVHERTVEIEVADRLVLTFDKYAVRKTQ